MTAYDREKWHFLGLHRIHEWEFLIQLKGRDELLICFVSHKNVICEHYMSYLQALHHIYINIKWFFTLFQRLLNKHK